MIETLAVIAIIVVLAAILFPVFGAVRRRGDHASCAGSLRQLGTALVLYANDHEGWVPPATTQTLVYEDSPWMTTPKADVEASPAVLRASMRPYVRSEAVWFCPADRWRGTDTLYLGQRHRLTSYWFMPQTEGPMHVWPPRMQLAQGRLAYPEAPDAVPLLMDAVGAPQVDSEARFADDFCARSNHPDDLVNALRHDLSLSRRPAKFWGAGNDCR